MGLWECHREINHGLLWKYFSEFYGNGRCRNWGTVEKDGVATQFDNSGTWRFVGGKLFYNVEQSSIKDIIGRELVDPLLSLQEDEVIWQNTQGDQVVLRRIKSGSATEGSSSPKENDRCPQ
ncbi:hypothetical protein WME98_27800 [Sorangium sp. So ce296]|uniref:Uncharacterized protein n=1 Tax=Sorangium cellulosum TaxID=56 RepID=A0A150T567_SORCE|nr:hypothetical protein BE18_49025 [Sorangium cellulosum]KYF99706.1 hypothetical protein BE20_58490 [Sorangium cellulosum]